VMFLNESANSYSNTMPLMCINRMHSKSGDVQQTPGADWRKKTAAMIAAVIAGREIS
jgi:hypothetical protein